MQQFNGVPGVPGNTQPTVPQPSVPYGGMQQQPQQTINPQQLQQLLSQLSTSGSLRTSNAPDTTFRPNFASFHPQLQQLIKQGQGLISGFHQAVSPLLQQILMGGAAGGLGAGMYNQGGVASVGARLGGLGGTLGIDNGRPFGSANVNGNVIGQFGPQGGQ